MSKFRMVAEGKYVENFRTIADTLEKRFRKAKNETLSEFFYRVRLSAIANIIRNNQETRVPLSGRLEGSIDYNVSRRLIWAGGDDVPYAAAHDSDQGTFTPIWPSNGKYLVFYNYRSASINKRRFVMKPGIAFFTEAWTSEARDLQKIFEQKIEEVY
jgi:hypothetical protein